MPLDAADSNLQLRIEYESVSHAWTFNWYFIHCMFARLAFSRNEDYGREMKTRVTECSSEKLGEGGGVQRSKGERNRMMA